MGIFKKALHSKIDVFVKFESAINLEIRDQIKGDCYLFKFAFFMFYYILWVKV